MDVSSLARVARHSRIDLLVEALSRTSSIAERRYLLSELETASLLADPGQLGGAMHSRITALGVQGALALDGADELPTQAVVLPLVAPDGVAFARAVYVAHVVPGLSEDELWLAPDASSAVRHALAMARRVAGGGAHARRLVLTAVQPELLRDVALTGRSLGAATYVSALSLLTGRPVRPGTVVSAEVVGSRLKAVDGAEAKVEAALLGRADARRVVLAHEDAVRIRRKAKRWRASVEIVGVRTLGELEHACLSVASVGRVDVDEQVSRARRTLAGAWVAFRWPLLREPLERLAAEAPKSRPDLRIHVLCMLAAARRHLGAPEKSARFLEMAERIAASPAGRNAVPDEPLVALANQRAMTALALYQPSRARTSARRAVRIARRARLRGELIKALGGLGLAEIALGDATRAIAACREALALTHAHQPDRCARSHAYLIEALGHAGERTAARKELSRALRHLDPRDEARRLSDEAWLRVSFAEGLAATGGDPAEIVDALSGRAVQSALRDRPLPGLAARRLRGTALVRTGRVAAGFALLAGSVSVTGTAFDAHLGLLAHVNVLREAALRLELGALDEAACARARQALAAAPRALRRAASAELRAAHRSLRDVTRRTELRVEDLERFIARSLGFR